MKLARLVLPLALSSLSFFVTGCAAQTDDSDDDEVAMDSAEVALSNGPSNLNYFQVTRRDFRRCAAPACGGFFVKRVNAATTLCANGKSEAECYVSAIDLKGTDLSTREEAEALAAIESGTALVKATMFKRRWTGQWIGSLRASEAWIGATGSKAEGTFYRVADNGIRCITAPCPSTTAYQLNSKDSHNVISVKFEQTKVPADQTALDRAGAALTTKDGVLVAGGVALPKCLPGSNCGAFVGVTEFYLRAVHTEGKSCGARLGAICNPSQFCSWAAKDICGAADATGKCAYKPQACIQLYKPVCACDGKTYGNACSAAAAGASVSSEGPCESDAP